MTTPDTEGAPRETAGALEPSPYAAYEEWERCMSAAAEAPCQFEHDKSRTGPCNCSACMLAAWWDDFGLLERACLFAGMMSNGFEYRTDLAALRSSADRAEKMEKEVERLRAELRKWPSLECPCCGIEGAFATFFEDGQATICGCGGIVMADGESAHISVDECENPTCLADELGDSAAKAASEVQGG